MSNVVKLRKNQPAIIMTGNLDDIDIDYTRAVREFINSEVRKYMKTGKLKALALRSGVGVPTISRLAYYETTRPNWHTVMAVILALDAMTDFAQLTMRWANNHPTSRGKK